ncbi:DUF6660 family protein [Flavobacterium kingsejongi]|uniref:DUF6660 family protein n=1 Tax=Flavobacterium kingsejongi TaxID=1678728 RepID=UPI00130085BE|nr:DUF6660 family protein [Flavobacterium kingsejongi]
MKKLRYITTLVLSAWLLLLTVLPCSDAHAQGIAVSQTAVVQAGDSHQDFCSPFCVCSCCASPIIMQAFVLFELPQFTTSYELVASFYESIISDFHGSIWQPPQLV